MMGMGGIALVVTLNWLLAEPALVDLSQAEIVAPRRGNTKAVAMLVEEVATRSQIRWPIRESKGEAATSPRIVIGSPGEIAPLFEAAGLTKPTQVPALAPEGYWLHSESSPGRPPRICIVGQDERGVLFGIGRLLRTLRMERGKVAAPLPLEIVSAPAMPLRGHQLGYRPKTNSYDAWNLREWEQYIRDLAVFGTNAIELIPPRSDDDDDSPHFPLPKIDMMAGMSRLAADYGLETWIWFPIMPGKYARPAALEGALREWGDVLKRLPRVDALFVPSGDPGDLSPKQLASFLEAQHRQLVQIHAKARIWISMQSFSRPEFEEMLAIVRSEPAWVEGIVFGPQTRVSLPKLRELLPARYPIRRYPDITHSLRCEYPVPDWDIAFAFTLAREGINPRPFDQATIFRAYPKESVGFITYSEGCNDDVNKIIWSGLGWDPSAKVVDILRDYGRYFVADRWSEEFAQGLVALERNWRGPALPNRAVDITLAQFQAMERAALPRERANWRFQQALYRAYYDAYQRRRLVYETDLEQQAIDVLRQARRLGSALALSRAEQILDRAESYPVAADLRARVFELAEALFQSIHMQLSVERYQAIDVGRGASLDTVDVPLNNRAWLKSRFARIRAQEQEVDRLGAIREILDWNNPGPGGFYDDLGDPSAQPHLVRDTSYAKDPGFLESTTTGFHRGVGWRLSWCTFADGLYDTPVRMRYPDLDPRARYKIRVVYAGDNTRAKVRLTAGDGSEIHPFIAKPFPVGPVEFDVPPRATASGALELTWRANPERGGPGRGCQAAEVWLIRIPEEKGKR